ncbi:PEGA domain-containing protein [Leptospira idonii]|uniref:PEGA domain-containing protein n=1 Tax=Leptospira idonii TaxID=1193500 RepID=A0A4R9M2H2_9LEPT|nr:PEGA domain-containing protein [Leptospira idonii]TGN20963.1 PEGA domain-containing protein [Leptospira idonii]
MNKKSMLGLLLAIVSLISLNCATIFKGSDQLVSINSNVSGATVELDGLQIGQTPYVGNIKKNGKLLVLKKEGYETKTIALSNGIDPMFWVNIIFPGIWGSSTDYSTGAMYSYAPSTFQVDLEQSKGKK